MLLLQFTGLSGAGKTTIANQVRQRLIELKYKVEILDGDEYRKTLCADLGFSREDRRENNRRLGILGMLLVRNDILTIISTINPYEADRQELRKSSDKVFTIWIRCGMDTLMLRDTKGLYRRAMNPGHHPEFIDNLSGVNDPYEVPVEVDLFIDTDNESIGESTQKLLDFAIAKLAAIKK